MVRCVYDVLVMRLRCRWREDELVDRMKLDSDHEKQVMLNKCFPPLAYRCMSLACLMCMRLPAECSTMATQAYLRRSTLLCPALRQCEPARRSARCCASCGSAGPAFAITKACVSRLYMYEEIISKLGPIFEKNISSSLAEIDFEREVGRIAPHDV